MAVDGLKFLGCGLDFKTALLTVLAQTSDCVSQYCLIDSQASTALESIIPPHTQRNAQSGPQ